MHVWLIFFYFVYFSSLFSELDFLNHFAFDSAKQEEGFGKHGITFHVTSKTDLQEEPNWLVYSIRPLQTGNI